MYGSGSSSPTTTTTTSKTTASLNEQVVGPPKEEQQQVPSSSSSLFSSLSLESKRNQVKQAFKHAWTGYEKYAYGHDEVRPITNETNDSWGAMGATLVDSLDTMYLMGLKSDFEKAVVHIERHMNVNQMDRKVSFFETTIRYLGGLLSAYDLSGNKVLLNKAKQLADRLLMAFDNTVELPYHEVNLKTGEAANARWTGDGFILSEVASVQLEFQHLSHLTGDSTYANKVNHALDVVVNAHAKNPDRLIGLYPVLLSPQAEFSSNTHITLGGLADSTYEYLLKQYLLSNKKEPKFLRLYLDSVVGIQKHLISKWKRPETNKYLLFPAELQNNRKNNKFEHLTCFVPGMLALGYQQLAQSEIDAHSKHLTKEDRNLVSSENMLDLAKELMKTCVYLYQDQPSNIGPDTVSFEVDRLEVLDPKYLLRPETIESIYILYQVTKDEMYREQGWHIFTAIQKHCKTPTAYSGLKSVKTAEQNNSMQSFFLAETLKYLYLLFTDKQPYPLNEWVLTTEAHLLKVHSTL